MQLISDLAGINIDAVISKAIQLYKITPQSILHIDTDSEGNRNFPRSISASDLSVLMPTAFIVDCRDRFSIQKCHLKKSRFLLSESPHDLEKALDTMSPESKYVVLVTQDTHSSLLIRLNCQKPRTCHASTSTINNLDLKWLCNWDCINSENCFSCKG